MQLMLFLTLFTRTIVLILMTTLVAISSVEVETDNSEMV